MPTVAVIPVKSFSVGKMRLGQALTPRQRSNLGKAMVEHVARVVTEAGLVPVLVTADADVATWAAGQGIPSIPDPGYDLNSAADTGVRWAAHTGSRWIVLHSDLPLLTAGELETFTEKAGDGEAIAPSSDGGTSAITATRELDFAYGAASFTHHLARLRSPEVVALLGLLHDVDSATDLKAACDHPRGRWLAQALR